MSASAKRKRAEPSEAPHVAQSIATLKQKDPLALPSCKFISSKFVHPSVKRAPGFKSLSIALDHFPLDLESNLLAHTDIATDFSAAFHISINAANDALSISILNFLSRLLRVHSLDLLPLQQNLAKEILSQNAGDLHRAIGPGNNARSSCAIKLLCCIARDPNEPGWSQRSRKAWNILSMDSKNLNRLLGVRIKKADSVAKADTRTLVTSLILNLLKNAATGIKAEILAAKGLLPALLGSLAQDQLVLVQNVLFTLATHVLTDQKLKLYTRLTAVESSWPVCVDLLSNADETENHPAAQYLSFCVTHIAQISDQVAVRTLNALLGHMKIDNLKHAPFIRLLLKKQPEVSHTYWNKMYNPLDPKAASKWVTAICQACEMVSLTPEVASLHHSKISALVDSSFPSVFNKAWISKALQHENALVAHLVALFLLSCLQKTWWISEHIDKTKGDRLLRDVANRLPDPQVIVGSLQKNQADAFNASIPLRLMDLYYSIAPSSMASAKFDLVKLAGPILTANKPEFIAAQGAALRLVPYTLNHSEWFKGEASSTGLALLLKLAFVSPSPDIQALAQSSIRRILQHSAIFDHDTEVEIDLWLAVLGDGSAQLQLFWVACVQKANSLPFRFLETADAVYAEHASSFRQSVMPNALVGSWLDQCKYQVANGTDAFKEELVSTSGQLALGMALVQNEVALATALVKALIGLFGSAKPLESIRKWLKKQKHLNAPSTSGLAKGFQDAHSPLKERYLALFLPKSEGLATPLPDMERTESALEGEKIDGITLGNLSKLTPEGVSAHHLKAASILGLPEPESVALLDKVLVWLVRRLAEDEEHSPETRDLVEATNDFLGSLSGALKPHLAEPVIEAAIGRRLSEPDVLQLLQHLVARTPNTSNTLRLCASFLASDIPALAAEESRRLPLVLLMQEFRQRLPENMAILSSMLQAYSGTLSQVDRTIKVALKQEEYRGNFALSAHIANWIPIRLRNEDQRGPHVLSVLEASAVYETCLEVMRPSYIDPTSRLTYDPEIIFALMGLYLGEDAINVTEFLDLVGRNVLGTLICGLASPRPLYKRTADRLLARLRIRLQAAAFTELDEIQLLLDHASNVSAPHTPMSALFLANALQAVGDPSISLYPAFMRHVLQRSTLDSNDVPLLYQLLYPQEEEGAAQNLLWLLDFLQQAMCQPEVWAILKRRQVVELLLGLAGSGVTSPDVKSKSLQVLLAAARFDVAATDLVRRSAILAVAAQSTSWSDAQRHIWAEILLNLVTRLDVAALSKKMQGLWITDATYALVSLHRGHTWSVAALRSLRYLVRKTETSPTKEKAYVRTLLGTAAPLAASSSDGLLLDVQIRLAMLGVDGSFPPSWSPPLADATRSMNL